MLKHFNLPAILLSATVIRLLVSGIDAGSSISILALSGLYFATYYFKGHSSEESINAQTLNRIVDLEEQLKATRDKVSSINFGMNIKKL